ncbi:hypothetical protein ACWDRB_16985 [Nonomuraea sp. NPDC003707]
MAINALWPVPIVMLMWFTLMALRPVRSFLSRRRVLVAVFILPLQPFALIGLSVAVWTAFTEPSRVNWPVGLMFGLAYLNGLAAFALVTSLQDRFIRRRARYPRG